MREVRIDMVIVGADRIDDNGDTANNDSVTVTGTAAADLLTVTPTANGASVLLNGSGSGVACSFETEREMRHGWR